MSAILGLLDNQRVFFQNVEGSLPIDTASHPRRPEFSNVIV
jgi:hypothetical protein